MNKEWFIFKGTHHLGPFSLEEMEEFFSVNEINAQSLVWREGAPKWEALSKVAELSFLVKKDKSPDLQVTPAPQKVLQTKEKAAVVNKVDDELPPPLPPIMSSKVKDQGDEPPPIPLDAILNPIGREYYKPKKGLTTNQSRIVLAVLATMFIMVLAWFFINEKSSSVNLRIKGVMPVYVEKLQETAAQNTPSITLAMALSLDAKTLYASTNKDGNILSVIKLQSLPKRLLGTEEVEITVRGIIKDHLGVFGRMQLTKGSQFVPGEYNVHFSGRKLHFLNKNFKFLNQYSFFKNFNTDYSYTTTALIYSGTPREFEKKILDYENSVTNELLKPFTDKLERLQTFRSILNKTTEDYLLALDALKKPSEISKFEAHYVKEISPIIQSLLLATIEVADKLEVEEKNSQNIIASYSSQVQIGKQIGELGTDMITETEKLKRVGPSEKSLLRATFEKRYKAIKTQTDSHIAKLEAEIQKISR